VSDSVILMPIDLPSFPSFPSFPATPEEMTAPWLTSVFAGHGMNAQVESFTQQRIGTGQIGQNIRFELTYAGGRPTDAPLSVVAKFVSPDPTSRDTGLALGIYEKEALFYRQFATQLTGRMRVPHCWAAEFDTDRQATILLMEDLAPAVQGDQMIGCTVAEAELAVTQLAALHATFWDDPSLAETPLLPDPKDTSRVEFLKMLLGGFWASFIDRYQDRLRADQIELGNRVVAAVDGWIQARTGPTTLVHGDFRADNLMIGDGYVATVDWQTLARGWGGTDLGYFIGASLTPDLRRVHERRLIALWHDRITELGVSGYSLDDAWADHGHGQFSGFITAVASSMITERTERGDEMFWTMADRHLTTAIDNHAGDLLPG
jgi:Ecdysteroid kinase-like family